MLTPGPGPLLRGLGVSLLCAAALTSCGGDDEPAAEPSPTPAVTSTPTPTATETPTTAPEVEAPEVPAFSKGTDGQQAFAEYVVQSWAYALSTNNATPLADVSAGKKPCQGCTELVEELDARESDGWSVYPFEVTVNRVKLIQSALGTTARVTFDVPETRSFFDDGSFRNSTPATSDAVFTVSMRVEGEKAQRAYRLIGFTIDQG